MKKNNFAPLMVSGMAIGFSLLLICVLLIPVYETVISPEQANAATTSAVTVSAEVATAISCSSDQAATVFTAWSNTTEIKTASPNITNTLSCSNSASGCTLYLKDAGNGIGGPGLWDDPNLIASANATLADGTEGYGVQATTTGSGSGGTLSLDEVYNKTDNTVGGLLTTNQDLASSTEAVTGRQVVVTHKAAIAATTAPGTYADTITYECTAN